MPQVVRVERIARPTADILVLDLVHPNAADLDPWEPGAHIDLHLPSGLTRQYSLCGDPADRKRYRLGILRETAGRGGSMEAHEKLLPGVEIQVSAPRNHFPLEHAATYVFVGGGIGVTPLLTMLRAVQRAGKPWQLIYGGRTRASMAFLDEIACCSSESGDLGRVLILPEDEYGLLDLGAIVGGTGSDTLIYACGPEPMLVALEQRCEQAGKRAHLHIERFAAIDPAATGGDAEPARAFKVELARSGITFDVPADQSLKSMLEQVGIEVPFSCEDGYCGSCETRVLSGEPEHHDCVLTPEEKAEGKVMMVCVGRCRSALLVLDL